MKKLLVLSALLAISSFAFAEGTPFKFSAGAGVSYAIVQQNQTISGTSGSYSYKDEYTQNLNTFGINTFFDATYLVFGIEYASQIGKANGTDKISVASATGSTSTDIDTQYTFLNFSLLAKYPFDLGNNNYLFPLVGIEYDLNINAKNKINMPSTYQSDLNDFYLDLGLGGDCSLDGIVKGLFLRPSLIVGIDLTGKKQIYDDFAKTLTSSGSYKVSYSAGACFKIVPTLQIGYSF